MLETCGHYEWECFCEGEVRIHECSKCCAYSWIAGRRTGDSTCVTCRPRTDPPTSDQPFVTKDSGKREEYPSGMRRDIQEGKPRFDLLLVQGQPYEDQFLTRFASLLERGATKYGENNWQLADSVEELDRFRSSGIRHMVQWACGETDEDHAAAVTFNLMAYEYVKTKVKGRAEQ